MTTKVKICGLSTPSTVQCAIEAGADFLGFVFHKSSPRFVETEVASYLTSYVPENMTCVGLFVDPTDEQLKETLENVRLDMIQLHGHERPTRVAAISSLTGKPIIRALSLKDRNDLQAIHDVAPMADWLLLDAAGTPDQPGGHGKTFDWSILENFKTIRPWMLAGGLNPENVAQAIRLLKPDAVDVSSGVEAARGIKDEDKIRTFIKNAKSAL